MRVARQKAVSFILAAAFVIHTWLCHESYRLKDLTVSIDLSPYRIDGIIDLGRVHEGNCVLVQERVAI